MRFLLFFFNKHNIVFLAVCYFVSSWIFRIFPQRIAIGASATYHWLPRLGLPTRFRLLIDSVVKCWRIAPSKNKTNKNHTFTTYNTRINYGSHNLYYTTFDTHTYTPTDKSNPLNNSRLYLPVVLEEFIDSIYYTVYSSRLDSIP